MYFPDDGASPTFRSDPPLPDHEVEGLASGVRVFRVPGNPPNKLAYILIFHPYRIVLSPVINTPYTALHPTKPLQRNLYNASRILIESMRALIEPQTPAKNTLESPKLSPKPPPGRERSESLRPPTFLCFQRSGLLIYLFFFW